MTTKTILLALLTLQGGCALAHPSSPNSGNPQPDGWPLFIGGANHNGPACLSGEVIRNVTKLISRVPGWIQKYLAWPLACLMDRHKNIGKLPDVIGRELAQKNNDRPLRKRLAKVGVGCKVRELWNVRQPGFKTPMKSEINDWPEWWGQS